MPQMEIVEFDINNNVEMLDILRGAMDPVYQSRIPAATRAGLDATMNAINAYSPAANQIIDQLINLIGAQKVKSSSFQNPLAKYKVGMLNRGETIQEVQIGMIKARAYNAKESPGEQELFGREATEVDTAFHTVNRRDRYKLTIQEDILDQAFLTENGLNDFVTRLMGTINTSDNWDEFILTARTLKRYYDKGGFFKVNVPNLLDPSVSGDGVRLFMEEVRAMSDTLPFISRLYNARHMPVMTEKSDLELITTPRAKAKMDVQALAAAFNPGNMAIESRMTIIPPEYWPIPGAQAILTTKRFWTIADKLMRMRQLPNPAGLYNNYWWHHHEVVSASPFENAILFTSEEEDTIVINDYETTGIDVFTLTDLVDDTPVTVTNGTATVERGHAYLVVTNALTDPEADFDGAVTLTVDGNSKLSNQTYVNQLGFLQIAATEQATTVIVHAKATDDNTFERDLTLTVTGPVIEGSIGLEIDENPNVINNTRIPALSPAAGGPVGTELSVNNGSWDTDDLTFTITWNRDGTPITSPVTTNNGRNYVTVTTDGGHEISATVAASKTGLTGGSATSSAVAITVPSGSGS